MSNILHSLREKILSIHKSGPILIGIDGVDGSGKSTFAKKLAESLCYRRKYVLQSSVDFFHNPKAIRHRPDKKSHVSFFEDSFNYPVLKKKLLDPLAHGTQPHCFLKYFDHKTDSKVTANPLDIHKQTILVFDGIFLHREEIRDYWDFSIFLDCSFDVTFQRMSKRDGCSENFRDEKNLRYYLGQLEYLKKYTPQTRASIVIDNNCFDNPFIIKSLKP